MINFCETNDKLIYAKQDIKESVMTFKEWHWKALQSLYFVLANCFWESQSWEPAESEIGVKLTKSRLLAVTELGGCPGDPMGPSVWWVSWWIIRHRCLYTRDTDFYGNGQAGPPGGRIRGPRGPKKVERPAKAHRRSFSIGIGGDNVKGCQRRTTKGKWQREVCERQRSYTDRQRLRKFHSGGRFLKNYSWWTILGIPLHIVITWYNDRRQDQRTLNARYRRRMDKRLILCISGSSLLLLVLGGIFIVHSYMSRLSLIWNICVSEKNHISTTGGQESPIFAL